MLRQPLWIRCCARRGLKSLRGTGSARCLEKRSRSASSRTQAMADRDDAMDVGAIEDDALNDDDEENENGDEVEEGYRMV